MIASVLYRLFQLILITLLLVSAYPQVAIASPFSSKQAVNTTKPTILARGGKCWTRMGPYATQHAANRSRNQMRARRYPVSGIWGQGGSIAYSYRSRSYYFKVWHPCRRRH